jgi:cytochrome P450
MLRRAIEDAFHLVGGAALDPAEELSLAEGQADYWEYLCALVDERRERPRDDFTSVLVAAQDADGTVPATKVVASYVNSLLGAGFETSAQTITLGVQSILGQRDQWELLRSDRSLLPGAVEECLRHRTVQKRAFRLTRTDVEIGGVTVPGGSMVAISLASANHDESFFEDPESFDIRRRQDNLAFGRGKHFCVGAPLARMEMRITLETLLDQAPEARIVEDQELLHKRDIHIDALLALQVDLGPEP